FPPVRVERVEDHRVEPERYSISEQSARSINRALAERRRVIAVGTTTTRALESACRVSGVRGQGSGVRGRVSGSRAEASENTEAQKTTAPSVAITPTPDTRPLTPGS